MNAVGALPSIRLYRYLNAKWALAALETGELHVGRIAGLNDPFEFMPALKWVNPMFSHKVVDEFMDFLVKDFHSTLGVICFSEQINDPVLWSHYSESHKGIALGFDVAKDDHLFPMNYPIKRPTFDVENFPSMTVEEAKVMIRRMLSAKAPSWSYEKEQRVFVDLATSRFEDGRYFHRIPQDWLKHVVLGIRCTVTENEARDALKRGGFANVTVSRARRCLTHFRVLH